MTHRPDEAARRERSYRQYCGLAVALDLVGERWTLLIVRELALGPRRYNELLADLPGIGTNLLAERLKKLCSLGVARRIENAGGHSYELDEAGESLCEPVKALARWGMSRLREESEQMLVRPQWGVFAVAAMADATCLPGVWEEYEFQVDDEVFHLRIADGTASAGRGPAEQPVLTATTDAMTFARLGTGMIGPFDAVRQGALVFSGDPEAVLRCSAVLGLIPSGPG